MKRRMKILISIKIMPVLALVLLVVFVPSAYAQVTEVVPKGNPADDVPNVQAAVDWGGTVILKAGTFNFSGGSIAVTNAVTIKGEVGASGNLLTTINSDGGTVFKYDGETTSGDYLIENIQIELHPLDNTEPSVGIVCNDVLSAGSLTVRAIVINCTGRVYALQTWYCSPDFHVEIRDNEITIRGGVGNPYGIRGYTAWLIVEGNTIDIRGDGGRGLAFHAEGPVHEATNNTIITNCGYAITDIQTPNALISGNEIIGVYEGGMSPDGAVAPYDGSHGTEISNNVVSGVFYQAFWIYNSSSCRITGNTVSGNPELGIEAWASPNTVITGNTISGTGQAGISVRTESDGATIIGNTIKNFRSTRSWGAPIIVERSSNCTVIENTLIDVYKPVIYAEGKGPIAGIRISGYGTWWYPCKNNTIQGNDYKKSGLPGWNTNHPTGPGCVLLEAAWWPSAYGAAIDNYVSETHHAYPPGTTICEQILDMTATPENPDGDNTEVGMEKCPEVSDYIDRLIDAAEREREEQELQEVEQQL